MPASSVQQRWNRRRSEPTEHAIQAAFFDWWRAYAHSKGVSEKLCFAIPNSTPTDRRRIYMSEEGLTAGVGDVFLAIPSWRKHGLFLEFKRPGKSATDAQAAFARAVEGMAFGYRLVDSTEEAIRVVREHLESGAATRGIP